jgi:hypothetical protein
MVERAGIRGVRSQDVQQREEELGSAVNSAAAAAQHGHLEQTAGRPAGPAVAGTLPAQPDTDRPVSAAAVMPRDQLRGQSGGGAGGPAAVTSSSLACFPRVQQHAGSNAWQYSEANAAGGHDVNNQHAGTAWNATIL